MSNRRIAIVLVIVLSLIAGGRSSSAQTPPSGAQPGAPPGQSPVQQGQPPVASQSVQTMHLPGTMNLSSVCQNLAANGPGKPETFLVPNTGLGSYTLFDGSLAGRLEIGFVLGATMAIFGVDAWFEVTQGTVVVFTCNAPLIFDLTKNDNMQFRLPAGTGLIVDANFLQGVFLALAETGDQVWITQPGHGATSAITLDIEFTNDNRVTCDAGGCWMASQFTPIAVDPTTGGGGCVRVRCWGN